MKLSIIQLFEEVKRKLMSKMVRRREMTKTWTTNILPMVQEIINKNQMFSKGSEVIYVRNEEFETVDASITILIHLNRRTCSRGEWNLSQIPCKHACKDIIYRRLRIENYIEPSLTKDSYLKIYSSIIHHVPSEKS